MPTGYTYPVVDGEITEFPDFAMACARAFGALVTMRDDAMNAPIPEEIKPAVYYAERLAAAKARVAELQDVSIEDARIAAKADYEKRIAEHTKYAQERVEQNARVNAMLEKVKAWVPPSPDHTGMKDFMIEQLIISLRDEKYESEAPKRMSPAQWLHDAVRQAKHDVEYYSTENDKEIKRAADRTRWIRELRASLASYSKAA